MREKKKFESGQAMVEFAIILPILLLIIFFIIDFCWVGYQKATFEQGVIHAGWNITADSLGDTDPLEDVPSKQTYSGSTVADPLLQGIQESSLWGLYTRRISVTGATATLYNVETNFNVPGRKPGDSVAAISRTRYMDLDADLSYEIYPLTFIGQMVFGRSIQVEKHLDCTRVIATQHRSE